MSKNRNGKAFDASKFTTGNKNEMVIENAVVIEMSEEDNMNEQQKKTAMAEIAARVMATEEVVTDETNTEGVSMKEKITAGLENAKDSVKGFFGKIGDFFKGIGSKIKAAWNRLVQFTKEDKAKATVTGVVAVCVGVAAGIFLPIPAVGAVFAGIGIAFVTFFISCAVQIAIKDRVTKAIENLDEILNKALAA